MGRKLLIVASKRYGDYVKEIAEQINSISYSIRFLYDIFVHPAFVAHPCPLLLAVNKTDLPKCDDNKFVFEKIEEELQKQR